MIPKDKTWRHLNFLWSMNATNMQEYQELNYQMEKLNL